jgi:fructose-1,6-bisphosphatase I
MICIRQTQKTDGNLHPFRLSAMLFSRSTRAIHSGRRTMPFSSLSLLPLRHNSLLPSASNHLPPPPPTRARLLLPPTTRQRSGALVLRPRAAATDDMAAATAAASPPTLLEHMGRTGAGADLTVLVAHIQSACKRIAALTASPGNADLSRAKAASGTVAAGRDAPKPLDELSVRARLVVFLT